MASSRTPYPEAARELLRATLFGAARDQLEQRAWSEVTMSDIAAAAGVSRQTLYKEFGNRNEFGLAFVIHEGERFLDDVEAAVRSHLDDPRGRGRRRPRPLPADRRQGPADPHAAQRRRHRRHAALRHHPGAAGRRSGRPRGSASVIEEGWPQAPKASVDLLSEALVRLAISYITNPGEAPDDTAAHVAQLLGPFIDEALGNA